MADDLPLPSTHCVHVQSLANTVIDAHGIFVEAVILEAVAVHVEDMARAAVGVDVPVHDSSVSACLERREKYGSVTYQMTFSLKHIW